MSKGEKWKDSQASLSGLGQETSVGAHNLSVSGRQCLGLASMKNTGRPFYPSQL